MFNAPVRVLHDVAEELLYVYVYIYIYIHIHNPLSLYIYIYRERERAPPRASTQPAARGRPARELFL